MLSHLQQKKAPACAKTGRSPTASISWGGVQLTASKAPWRKALYHETYDEGKSQCDKEPGSLTHILRPYLEPSVQRHAPGVDW